MPSVIMLSAVMVNGVMLNVVAPLKQHWKLEFRIEIIESLLYKLNIEIQC
jgi:hypothetical protein